MHKILGYGLDYLRYRVFTPQDTEYIERLLPYTAIAMRNFHGSKFVDITGGQLETIRMFDDVDVIARTLAGLFPVNRVDVFVDIEGSHLGGLRKPGTVILNNGRVETIYSHNLKNRGNVPAFYRAYDAKAAGHYTESATRFECEFKRESARALLTVDGWAVNPIGALLHRIALVFGIKISIEDVSPVDFDAPRRLYEHSRERFYTRYGQGIARDIEMVGVESLYNFILECVKRKVNSNA